MDENNILAYRIEQLEEMLKRFGEDFSKKLDSILERSTAQSEKLATHDTQLRFLRDGQDKQDGQIVELQKEIVQVKLTMAERIMPGAISGSVIVIVAGVLKFLLTGSL